MTDIIEVTAHAARKKFTEWLARGEAIGVFENVDLGHPNIGHKVFLPLDAEDQAKVVIGQTQAPDGPYGLGWRYRLNLIARSLDAFEFVRVCVSCDEPLTVADDFNEDSGEWADDCRSCRTGEDDERRERLADHDDEEDVS